MSYNNSVSGISEAELQQTMGLRPRMPRGTYIPPTGPDRFTGSQQQQPQQEFSLLRAAGKFFQGAVVDTISGLFSFKGLAMLAGAGAICALGGAPLVLAAGLGLGGFQLAKGAFGAVSNYASGNYQQAEESFRDIGGGTVAVVGAAAGIRARYASVEGVGGKLGALWGDVRGASQYKFVNSAGVATEGNMYQMMGSRAKSGFGAIAEVFNPAEGTKSTFFGRLKGLFVAEESVAATRTAAQEAHVLAKEQAALTAECEVVESALAKNLTTAKDAAGALAEIKGLTPKQFAQLKSGLGTLAEAEAFAADGALVAEAAKLRPGLDAAAIKAMNPTEFAALQAEVTHATKLASITAGSPAEIAASKMFPGVDIAKLNPSQVAQLEAALGSSLVEAATAIKNGGAVSAELATALGKSPAELAAMELPELTQLLANNQIKVNAAAAEAPSFFTRIFQSSFWRNTFGRRDGAAASTTEATATNSSRFTIGENAFVNNGAGFATPGVRRIAAATSGMFRDE